jgi:hypothetical protein
MYCVRGSIKSTQKTINPELGGAQAPQNARHKRVEELVLGNQYRKQN